LIGPKVVAFVRNRMFRILLPLTLLVAWPLAGGAARAGFDTPVSLVSRPSAELFGDAIAPQAAFDDTTTASSADTPDSEVDSARQDANSFFQLFTASPSANLNAGAPSTGAGSQSPPSDGGAAGMSNLFALASRLTTDAPALVGVLFLQTASRMPPPFSSRLFRPPR
jgi:hypothetical protein